MSTTEVAPVTGSHPTEIEAWRGFRGVRWQNSIDTRLFLQNNYTPFEGDASFLAAGHRAHHGPCGRG